MSKVVVKGITFGSMKDACKHFGVSYKYVSTIKNNYGLSFNDAIEYMLQGGKAGKLKVGDKEFNNLSDACRKSGVNINKVRSRMRRGYSLEDSLKHSLSKISVRGRDFQSLSEACRYFDVSYRNVRYAIGKGMSIEEAISKHMKDEFVVNDIRFSTVREACEYYGVSSTCVYQRMRRNGATLEEAVHYYTIGGSVIVNGIRFRTKAEACRYFNVEYTYPAKLIKAYGVSFEEAINYLLEKKGRG